MFRLLLSLVLVLNVSCSTAGQTAKQTAITKKNADEVLKKGTSQTKVLEVLGSPNTVTSEGNGTETWSYLRRASKSEGTGVGVTVFQSSLSYLTNGWLSGSADQSTLTTQDNTLIVYFDKDKKVSTHSFRSEVF